MRLVVVVILTALGACSDWPRMANLPDEEGVAVGDGATSLVQMSWENLDSADSDNDQPNSPGVAVATLDLGQGLVIEAALDGIGWDNSGEPLDLVDGNCPAASATRTPLAEPGDYIGDVDFFRLTAQSAGTLCAEVALDQASVGWDLAVRPVDACGIPTAGPVDDLGVSVGGTRGGWQLQVEADQVIALSFAGYSPNDLALVVGYDMNLSLVPNAADGSPGLCPAPPASQGSR